VKEAMQPLNPYSEDAQNAKPWHAQAWPWLLMLGPFLVILAGGYTTWLAFSKPDAMVVDDYYKQGKAINQDLRRDRMATRMGLSGAGRYDAATGKLSGMLRSFGSPIAGKIRIYLAHATQPERDIQLSAQLDQRGEFSVDLPMLERARWQVLIENDQRAWRLTGVWNWPQQQSVEIKADLPPAE
jgi:hypothetical protein